VGDATRSLVISQRLLGTEEIILIHHTDCGMLTFSDDEFREQIGAETGITPSWAAEAFAALDTDATQHRPDSRQSSVHPTEVQR
jgi:carbonic anhydrase